jgi:rhodanese-related sulfurtransferase
MTEGLAFRNINIFIGLFMLLFASCNQSRQTEALLEPSVENTHKLLDWLEASGNYINSPEIPSIIDAEDVYPMLGDSVLIVDVRPGEEYRVGHIETAINLQPDQVLAYVADSIEAPFYAYLLFVCNNGNISGHVAAVLRLLGFDNVYAIRFGLSGWDKQIAESYWLANTSSHLEGKLDHIGYSMNAAGEYPATSVKSTEAEQMLWERAARVIAESPEAYSISIADYWEKLNNFYAICYWPDEKYMNNGHFPGSVQYEPKKSLTRDTYLNTLPIDKPIVLYCYSGQHTTFVAAYLRILGYDARSLSYGANGYIHQTMAETEARPSRTYTEDLIQNLPLVKSPRKWLLVP